MTKMRKKSRTLIYSNKQSTKIDELIVRPHGLTYIPPTSKAKHHALIDDPVHPKIENIFTKDSGYTTSLDPCFAFPDAFATLEAF